MGSGRPQRPQLRVRWQYVGVVVGAVALVSALGVLYLVPFSQTTTETSQFALVVPYNASESACTSVTFHHSGSYTFEVNLPTQATGDVFFLTATGPMGDQLYRSPGDAVFQGTFAVNASSIGYQFCLETPKVSYTPVGGAAAGVGTFSYPESHPIL